MIANYHTHTTRCNHAVGSEREYIECAIRGGLQVLGFSDHSPMPFKGEYYSGHRMKLQETAEYINTLRDLRAEYKDRIQILIGFEVEYYPDLFADFLSFTAPFTPDYLILGQHALGNEQDSPNSAVPTQEEKILKWYVDQVMEGLSTGKFLYLAHPDMIHYIGDEKIYRREMTRLCEFCRQNHIPLEVNMLGIMEKRHYPCDVFWEIAKTMGNTAVLGCDAHRPDVLCNTVLHETAQQWAEAYNLPLIQQFDL